MAECQLVFDIHRLQKIPRCYFCFNFWFLKCSTRLFWQFFLHFMVSIGERSGLLVGHSNKVMTSTDSHAIAELAVWHEVSSWRRGIDGRSSRISRYLAALKIPSTKYKLPKAHQDIHPKTIRCWKLDYIFRSSPMQTSNLDSSHHFK